MPLFTTIILIIALLGYSLVHFEKFNYHEPIGRCIIVSCYIALYLCNDAYTWPSVIISVAGIAMVAVMFYDEYKKIKFNRDWQKMNEFAERYRDKFEKH